MIYHGTPFPTKFLNAHNLKEKHMSKSSLNINNMFNADAIMRRFFRRVDNVVWDMSTGKPGVATAEGIATCVGVGEDAQITINPIAAMGMALPGFAQNTAMSAVQVGDMIIYGAKDNTGWVTSKTEKSLHLIKADGTHTQISPPKTQMLDIAGGVMVVRSLMNMLPGGTNGLMGNMMMLQLMGGEDGDVEDMLPLMLMMQGAGATSGDADAVAASNPFAGMQQMMPMMMMAKMLGKSGNKSRRGGTEYGGPDFRG